MKLSGNVFWLNSLPNPNLKLKSVRVFTMWPGYLSKNKPGWLVKKLFDDKIDKTKNHFDPTLYLTWV
jgi:hypothetical protein